MRCDPTAIARPENIDSSKNSCTVPTLASGDVHVTIDVIDINSANCHATSVDLKSSFRDLRRDLQTGVAPLHFKDLTCFLSRLRKCILKSCSAQFDCGTVTAIMGPSGAGKSTLLDYLGQRIHILRSHSIKLSGSIYLGCTPMTPSLFRARCAYVPQHDALWSTLTVREHFLFCIAFLDGCYKQERPVVSKVIQVLGLASCADTMVGGPLVKGCSGGQQRRTSIGIEILSRPEVLLLDEPTTGLDAVAALNIVRLLRYLANSERITVVNTIHQPSSYIWEEFDNVLLLSTGQVAYAGSPHDALAHMLKLGVYAWRLHIARSLQAHVCSVYYSGKGKMTTRTRLKPVTFRQTRRTKGTPTENVLSCFLCRHRSNSKKILRDREKPH
ncbi:hypothetical protein AURANDRAFT_68084 [Aureococcus anophagefferens]|uniref:ABC transporter domain-containing protein n=1 Tax=Aureococcus anophagefferens TaxID=44056 RepID=F0YNF5_AURAN|nr:hypothetical protein AURANDRAFT_68084 [Aureococcus anophagefferens]EGB03366.1 hypothetical protein AURANDRAFT_68084 [Aureococcus anophagefferens]|eukprot:XP_009041939.1 hypothetical protein AURANDRAFT_68084 [Aureococcus anophagefferens]